MNENIIAINENTWRIEDGGVRLFLLSGAERALLIDTGMTLTDARAIAQSLTDKPLELLNTHADRDHIAGNAAFDRFYMHPAEAAHYRESGLPGEIVPINDGDVIDLGGRPLRIIHLPGHTPGSVAVLDENARVLISGDPIQAHGRIFMMGAHRDMAEYIKSLDRLTAFTGDFDEVWPSHADIPVSPDTIARLRDGARDILAGQVPGRVVDMHGRAVTLYDLGFCALLCDA